MMARVQGQTAPERSYGRAAGELRPADDRAGLRAHRHGLGADLDGRDARDLHRLRAGGRAALDDRPGPRLGDGRVRRCCPPRPASASSATSTPRAPGRPHRRDPAADRPLAARWSSTSRRSANAPSTSTATCCRPTAARAARRSPAPTSRCRWRARGCSAKARSSASPLTGSVAAISCGVIDGVPLLDLDYREDSTRGGRRERRDDRRGRARRAAGDGRAHAALARAPRRAAGARRERDRSSCAQLQEQAIAAARRRRPARRRGRVRGARRLLRAAAAGDAQRAQAARVRAPARRRRTAARPSELDVAAGRRRAAAGGRRDVRRERARQGARGGARGRPRERSPTTRASPPRRSGGAPGVRSARYAGEHATDAREPRQAAARGARRQRAGVRVRDRLRRSRRAASSGCSRDAAAGAWPSARAASAASATTRRSCPTTGRGGLTMARAERRAEGRDQPSRARRARAGWQLAARHVSLRAG